MFTPVHTIVTREEQLLTCISDARKRFGENELVFVKIPQDSFKIKGIFMRRWDLKSEKDVKGQAKVVTRTYFEYKIHLSGHRRTPQRYARNLGFIAWANEISFHLISRPHKGLHLQIQATQLPSKRLLCYQPHAISISKLFLLLFGLYQNQKSQLNNQFQSNTSSLEVRYLSEPFQGNHELLHNEN